MLFKHYQTLSNIVKCHQTLIIADCYQTLSNVFERHQTLPNAFKHRWMLSYFCERFSALLNATQTLSNAIAVECWKMLWNAIECQQTLSIADCYLNTIKRFRTFSNAVKLHQTLLSFWALLNCPNAIEHTFKRCQTISTLLNST